MSWLIIILINLNPTFPPPPACHGDSLIQNKSSNGSCNSYSCQDQIWTDVKTEAASRIKTITSSITSVTAGGGPLEILALLDSSRKYSFDWTFPKEMKSFQNYFSNVPFSSSACWPGTWELQHWSWRDQIQDIWVWSPTFWLEMEIHWTTFREIFHGKYLLYFIVQLFQSNVTLG